MDKSIKSASTFFTANLYGSNSFSNKSQENIVNLSKSISQDLITKSVNVLFIGFNEDCSCFFCGTNKGFYVYNLNPFRERFHREFNGGIGIIEQLGKTNIVMLVGGGNSPQFPPNQVVIWDDYQNKQLTELTFSSEVKSVKCRQDKVIIILYEKVVIHKFDDLSLIKQYETYINPDGLGDISGQSGYQVLAIPGNKIGDLRIEMLDTNKSYIISAHKQELSQIRLNNNGKMCATASNRGTIIRIWDTRRGKILRELRRGIEPVNILSLAFDLKDTALCVSSDKGTAHVYSLIPREDAMEYEKNRKSNLGFMKKYLPTYFASEWSLMSFSVPSGATSICGFIPGDKSTLMIITKIGKIYYYRLIPEQNLIQLINTDFYDDC